MVQVKATDGSNTAGAEICHHMNDTGQYIQTCESMMLNRMSWYCACASLWVAFLQQNNGVTFCSYLLCLLQSSPLSFHSLLWSRLSLCVCISECRRWRTCVDLVLVQEVSMLSPTFLFTHYRKQTERKGESLPVGLNLLPWCHALSILFLYL